MCKRILLSAVASLTLAGVSHATLFTQLGILDLDANGGINPATGAAWQAGDTYRFAFITGDSLTDATSDNIATYNSIVQDAADNSSIAAVGTVAWNAIVSTPTVDARDNTSTNPNTDGVGEAIFLLDGTTLIATSYADLWDGSMNPPNNRIRRTENNQDRPANHAPTGIWGSWTGVWTGTTGDGTASNPLGSAGDSRLGLMAAEPNFWISRSTAGQSNLLPLYGLSQTLTVIPEPSSLALIALGGALIARRRRG